MAIPQFIHLPFEGHLDCFQALKIMNKFRWGFLCRHKFKLSKIH